MLAIGAAVPAELALTGEEIDTTFQTHGRVYAGTAGTVTPLVPLFSDGEIGRERIDALRPARTTEIADLLQDAHLVLTLAIEALRAMFLLDSINVELAPVAVSRQVRRSVERSEGQRRIAMTVHVRRRSRKIRARQGKGPTREFAYAFERIGHYRHVTRGPHATEQYLKPCPREDAAHRATGGRCRREWIPPHVVGADEGKPLIPKARIADDKRASRQSH
jgi:hypothetical protein